MSIFDYPDWMNVAKSELEILASRHEINDLVLKRFPFSIEIPKSFWHVAESMRSKPFLNIDIRNWLIEKNMPYDLIPFKLSDDRAVVFSIYGTPSMLFPNHGPHLDCKLCFKEEKHLLMFRMRWL